MSRRHCAGPPIDAKVDLGVGGIKRFLVALRLQVCCFDGVLPGAAAKEREDDNCRDGRDCRQ